MIRDVWWFYTVILGMSFGQVLIELAVAIRNWRWNPTQPPYLPAVLWQVFLLVLIVEVWLAVTYYRATVLEISILRLIAFLAVPAGTFVMCFLLPVSGAPRDDEATPAQNFERVRPVFFGVLIAIVVINLAHGLAVGELALDIDLLFQGLIILGAVIGLFLRTRRSDVVLALAMIAVVCAYIGLGYSTVAVDV